MKNKSIIFGIGVVVIASVAIFSFGFFIKTKVKPDISVRCENVGNGNWLRNYEECEYTNREWCENEGGVFNECESACRHTKYDVCTLQCVTVCSFGGKDVKEEEEEEEPVSRSFQYKDMVRLRYPLPESKVSSPLTIMGEARGNWFFEGSFPVVVTNWDGLIIAEGVAQADGEWMTEDYVPFKVTLDFQVETSVSDRGALILQKDNPSGLPENDDALEITIFFEKQDI